MLTADGVGQEQFVALWRDAMWDALTVSERTRLVLELGRSALHAEGRAAPLAVAYVPTSDAPFAVIHLRDAPADAAQHAALRERLAEVGATEVYLLVTLVTGPETYLLAAWGEGLPPEDEPAGGSGAGTEAVWMRAYRWVRGELEEAAPVVAPDPSQTALSARFRGLVSRRH